MNDGDGFIFLATEKPVLVDYDGEGGEIALPETFGGKAYEIGHAAFKYVRSITAVTAHEGVKVIGACAFESCEELTTVRLLGAQEIGYSAFAECHILREVSLNDGLRVIEGGAFQFCEELRELDIPRSVTFMGRSILQYCDKLERLSLPVCEIDRRGIGESEAGRYYV